MKVIKKIIFKHWPIIGLALLVIILYITNYRAGTILSGWDNLHPEFNFGVNIKRSVFAVWQEYQGLGLLGGMAHSTDLLRQIFLLILSLFLPLNSLRYVWTFLMLFVGASGAYLLIKHILNRHSGEERNEDSRISFGKNKSDPGHGQDDERSASITAFLGACFYLFNLSTMQMFSVPFESFVGLYGFLPLALLASIQYLKKPNLKRTIFLMVTLIISTPAWYLQTVFIVFMIALTILLLPAVLQNRTKKKFLNALKLYAIIFVINSFWLMPAAYFTVTSSQVNLNSKINQMATETILLQNKEFGTLPDVMLLKGFLLNGVDPSSKGTITFMLKPWRDHLANPLVAGAGYLLFAVVFLGFIMSVRSKSDERRGFSYLFVFAFIALAIDTFPFNLINSLFRNYIPIINQIFRFPFTKFSTLASLIFAVLFAIGIREILERVKGKASSVKSPLSSPFTLHALHLGFFLLLIIFTLPSFRGNLFYEKEQTKIPKEYTDLFTFFKNQDQDTRIANFPQNTFWGWSFYNWPTGDYGGSGFIWYGIKQPILDRAFDVWSNYSENYYFEVSQAVYSKNVAQFEKVLNKYQINWVLVDKNIFDTSSSKALFVPELEDLLNSGSFAHKTASFGNIDVYKIDLSPKPKSFVFLSKNLPTVNKYNWNNNDHAYSELGNYISSPSDANGKWPASPRGEQMANGNSVAFPFRSLFSLKSQKENEFTVKENPANIEFTAELLNQTKKILTIPSFAQKEKLIPVLIKTEKTDTGTPRLSVKLLLPQVYLGEKKLSTEEGPSVTADLPEVSKERLPLKINVNGASSFPLTNETKEIGVVFFTLNTQNVITVSDRIRQSVIDVKYDSDIFSGLSTDPQLVTLPPTDNSQTLKVQFPKINDGYLSFTPTLNDAEKIQNCYSFRSKNLTSKRIGNHAQILSSTDTTGCTSFFAKNLPHDQSFAVFIKSRHVTGQALRFWVENIGLQYGPLDTYLPKNIVSTTSSYILPPMEQFGASYSFHFDNASIGRDKTINEINTLAVYPIFYNYLEDIQIKSGDINKAIGVDDSSLLVSHPNESLYILNLPPTTYPLQPTIVLSQSYNPGWKAYRVQSAKFKVQSYLYQAFPFIFGREIKNHVLVNNWENGWNLDREQRTENREQVIVLVYLPQYLEYIGFLLLFVAPIVIFIRTRVDKKRSV